MFWTGWVVTALPALSLVFSAILKFIQPQEVLKEFDRLGWQGASVMPLGIVELACTIVYLIPQTSVLGAILLTGYLGGATATHVRINDNFAPPIVMGVLVWLGLFLRDARLRALIPLRR
jgi:xanthine/uracil permease